MKLELQPITYAEACEFIQLHHSHHLPPQGWKFGIAVNNLINIDEFTKHISLLWNENTSNHPEWSLKNPSLGQCAVTSLIFQDLYGGELMRCKINDVSHYYNTLNDKEYDLTSNQFGCEFEKIDPTIRDRDYVLSFPDTVKRYNLLRSMLKARTICGVITIGRPVSRHLDDGWVLEVTRCCTDSTPHVASKLYAAAWRACRAMGYKRLITYTLIEEEGISLKAAGWKILYQTKGGSWNCKTRPRVDKHPIGQKTLWEAT